MVFRGPASVIRQTFGTTLHTYTFQGKRLVAPTAAPKVPASVRSRISGMSLDQGRLLNHPNSVRPDGSGPAASPRSRSAAPAPTNPAPCSTYYGQNSGTVPAFGGKTSFPTYICGYIPSQLRSAYGLTKLGLSGTDGTGQPVAIVDAYASPTIVKDTNLYAIRTGSAPLTPSLYSQIVPDPKEFTDTDICQGASGWQGEQTLDVQSAHGIAPGAKILYVGGTNCGGGIDLALSSIIDKRLSTIVSNSYGNTGEAVPDSVLYGQQNQHIQAAATGIGLYFSSGDSGDEFANLGYVSPDFPASSPFAISVGGTSLKIGASGNYIGETGWGTARVEIVKGAYVSPPPGPFRFGAGGGVSDKFAQPAYQKGVVPDALANSKGGGPARVSPDVAAIADPYTGFLIGLSPINDDATLTTDPFTTETYGGTSLASPVVAAQAAITQQGTGRTIGFANPALYAGYKAAPSITRDVQPSATPDAVTLYNTDNNRYYLVALDRDSSLTTAKGYDQDTGLGSLDVATIIAKAKQVGPVNTR